MLAPSHDSARTEVVYSATHNFGPGNNAARAVCGARKIGHVQSGVTRSEKHPHLAFPSGPTATRRSFRRRRAAPRRATPRLVSRQIKRGVGAHAVSRHVEILRERYELLNAVVERMTSRKIRAIVRRFILCVASPMRKSICEFRGRDRGSLRNCEFIFSNACDVCDEYGGIGRIHVREKNTLLVSKKSFPCNCFQLVLKRFRYFV